jgi:hypothetical protein
VILALNISLLWRIKPELREFQIEARRSQNTISDLTLCHHLYATRMSCFGGSIFKGMVPTTTIKAILLPAFRMLHVTLWAFSPGPPQNSDKRLPE